MGINIADLPEAYQRQAARKILEAEREKRERRRNPADSSGGTGDSGHEPPVEKTESAAVSKPGKYRNIPDRRVSAAGHEIRFDSRKEARRYDELTARLRAGEIRDLRLQAEFTLQEAFTDADGNRTRAIRYKADFTYQERVPSCGPPYKTMYNATDAERWRLVVEDVKSRATRTDKYKLKRKLMKDRFGIDIQEV